MATLRDIVTRGVPAVPWAEGDNIPWNDPAFSERMLGEHLTDRHDLASRRSTVVDRQVEWLSRRVPDGAPILDLACGPGLYLNRLARLGMTGVGIDFSPASIRYARQIAEEEALDVRYVEGDLRREDFGGGFGAALLLYGQLNVFRREDARSILQRAAASLVPGGLMVVEAQRYDAVRQTADEGPTWSTHESGLFSDRPHLLLNEAFWDEARSTVTERFYVVDAESGVASVHAMSTVAYRDDELRSLFEGAGVPVESVDESLSGDDPDPNLVVFSGRRSLSPGR